MIYFDKWAVFRKQFSGVPLERLHSSESVEPGSQAPVTDEDPSVQTQGCVKCVLFTSFMIQGLVVQCPTATDRPLGVDSATFLEECRASGVHRTDRDALSILFP